MTSQMMKKKKMPHTRKDCLKDEYRTAVRMVEDMFRDTTEPHLRLEVRKVQSKEFATFGGKNEVQKGIDFIDRKKQVVSLPTARNSMAVYTIAKEVESVKSAMVEVMLCMPLNPAKMSVMRDSQDYYDVKKEEVLVKTSEMSVIFPPTRGYEEAEWGMKVYSIAVESKSVKKSAVVEDMSGVPLSLTNDSVTEGSDFNDVQGAGLSRRASWDEEEVLKDANEPHLPTRVLGVYWKAARAPIVFKLYL